MPPEPPSVRRFDEVARGLDDLVADMEQMQSLVARVPETVTRARDLLHELRYRHPLTGLLNGQAFEDALSTWPEASPLVVMSLEVDGFKNLNTTYGHDGGDRVLQGIAAALDLQARCTPGLGVFHLSGDEFAALEYAPSEIHAVMHAEGLKTYLDTLTYPVVAGRTQPGEVTVTISIAFALAAGSADDRDHLVRLADRLAEYGKLPHVRRALAGKPVSRTAAGPEFDTWAATHFTRSRLECRHCQCHGYVNHKDADQVSRCPVCCQAFDTIR